MIRKKVDKEEIDKLQRELAKFKKQAEENLAGWKRALADYENFKKRKKEEEEELIKWANENLILDILPILDNFRNAYLSLPKELVGNEWVCGIKHVKHQLENLLKNKGVEEIKSVGEEFDPELHEAVEKIKSKKEKANVIVEEVLKGYKLNGKVIRAAKVKVVG